MSFLAKASKLLVPRSLRNWIKSPTRSSLWVWDEIQHLLGINPTLKMRGDWSLKCHPRAARWFRQHIINDPEQCLELDNFVALAQDNMVLFDVGAHFGLFTLAALHYGGPGARAIAVDPSPSATRMIRSLLSINGYDETCCRVILAAVGDRVGSMDLVAAGPLAGGYYVPPSTEHSRSDLSQVPMTTVDHLSKQTCWSPTHLKVDVEGAEAAVLYGAEETLRQQPAPTLCLELHNEMIRSQGRDPAAAPAFLDKLGYKFYDLDQSPLTVASLTSSDLIRVAAHKEF